MSVIKILLVDDNPMFLMGLRRFFAGYPEIEIVGELYSAQHVIETIERLRPDVLLVDITMPVISGLSLLETVRKHDPKIALIVLTLYNTEEYSQAAARAGADAFVSKSMVGARLINTIKKTLETKNSIV